MADTNKSDSAKAEQSTVADPKEAKVKTEDMHITKKLDKASATL